MNIGNRRGKISVQQWCKAVLVFFLMYCGASAYAIDNPDAPDYVGDFLERASVYAREIQQTPHTTQGYVIVYARYEDFLNDELNSAYTRLMAKLDGETKHALRRSQERWLRYRDQEFEFIVLNWTYASFGSASVISRGDYRTRMINDRIILLLYYLQSF